MSNTKTSRTKLKKESRMPERAHEMDVEIEPMSETEFEVEELKRRDRIENPWNYESETEKIYTGQEMAEIVRDAEKAVESVTIMDFVRWFLRLNTDSDAAIDVFAAAASFKYDVKERRKEE